MVFVQNLFGQLDIANLPGFLLPRHGKQPVEIVSRDRRFGRHWRHHFKPLQFLQSPFRSASFGMPAVSILRRSSSSSDFSSFLPSSRWIALIFSLR